MRNWLSALRFSLLAALVFGQPGAALAEAALNTIDVADVQRLQSEGAVVIDVRRADEWRATGVVPESRLITAFDETGQFQPNFLEVLLRDTEPSDPIVLICLSGARSAAVGRFLAERQGYAEVYNVAGGMVDWMRKGLDVEPCAEC